MKKFVFMCCLLVVTSVSLFAQVNPVNQGNFYSKVSQLNALISQNDLVGANAVWVDIGNMMAEDQDYIKLRLNNAKISENVLEQNQFTTLAEQQSTYYSEAVNLRVNMVPNQTALINKLNQFGANIF